MVSDTDWIVLIGDWWDKVKNFTDDNNWWNVFALFEDELHHLKDVVSVFVLSNWTWIIFEKKEKQDLFFGYIWNVGKWTCYVMQARNLLQYKKKMNKRGNRSHRCLLKRKKWNVEDIGVVHWNDILLLLVGCFGHQCAIGGIMMIWGCHLLAKGLMSGVKLVIL